MTFNSILSTINPFQSKDPLDDTTSSDSEDEWASRRCSTTGEKQKMFAAKHHKLMITKFNPKVTDKFTGKTYKAGESHSASGHGGHGVMKQYTPTANFQPLMRLAKQDILETAHVKLAAAEKSKKEDGRNGFDVFSRSNVVAKKNTGVEHLNLKELQAQVLLRLAQRDGGVSHETAHLVTKKMSRTQLMHLFQRITHEIRPMAQLPKSNFSPGGEFMYPVNIRSKRMQNNYRRI